MKRYVDREKFMQNLETDKFGYTDSVKVGIALDKSEADVVQVVRCKDCKRWMKDVAGCSDFVGRCEWANYMVGANGYCVYGERKVDSE